jgi:hypothetical protein
MSRDGAPKRTFLISMDESCYLTSMGWCVCGYGSDLKKCDGELADRPEWCPMVLVRVAKTQFDITHKEK